MGYIINEEKSPSPIQSLNLPFRPLFRKNANFFIFFKDIQKIYGPLVFANEKITFKNRRGLPIKENFYISLQKKIIPLTPEQEQLLFHDLKQINEPQMTPNVMHLSFVGSSLNIFITNNYPYFFTQSIQKTINLEKIKKESQLIITILNKIVENYSAYDEILLSLKQYGQNLYNLFFSNSMFHDYFSTIQSTYLSIHLPESLFFVPFEFMFDEQFFGLKFKFSRLLSKNIRNQYIPYKHKTLGLFSFKNALFKKENDAIQKIFLKKKKITNLYVLTSRPNVLKINEYKFIHYSGHSKITKNSILWYDQFLKLNLSNFAFLPYGIFSNSCNEHFFSNLFYKNLLLLFHRHLHFWLGSVANINLDSSKFSLYFYSQIIKKMSIGQALLNTKKYFYENNNPQWMQYTLAGNPILKIQND